MTQRDYHTNEQSIRTVAMRVSHPLIETLRIVSHTHELCALIDGEIEKFSASAIELNVPIQTDKNNTLTYGIQIDDSNGFFLSALNSINASNDNTAIQIKVFFFESESLEATEAIPTKTFDLSIDEVSWQNNKVIAQASGIAYHQLKFPKLHYTVNNFPGIVP